MIIYCVILLTFRLMGKREIGQLSVVDFVISIMIAELAVTSIEDTSTSLFITLLPIFSLLFIQLTLAYLSLKAPHLRRLMDGEPTVIIKDGKIDKKQMRKQRYNFDDLLMQLREKNVKRIDDVEFAILEPNGKLSVLKQLHHDDNITKDKQERPLPLPLIEDGKVQEHNLARLHKTPLWLRQKLRVLGYKNIKLIASCILDKNEVFHIKLKEE
ncbi:YetF domain-containing protein [Pullulanibacillus pueri]|nr:DUF421 domain-containing protein [Pullulanibacillus pueri]